MHTDKIIRKKTNNNGEEEMGKRDIQDRRCDVEEPVWCHGEKPEKQEEEKQAVPILLYLFLQYCEFLRKSTYNKLFAVCPGEQEAESCSDGS